MDCVGIIITKQIGAPRRFLKDLTMTLAKDKPQFDLKRVFALCFAVYAVLMEKKMTGVRELEKKASEML